MSVHVTLYPDEDFEKYPVYHVYITSGKDKIFIGIISTMQSDIVEDDEDGKFYEEVLDFSDYEIKLSVEKLYKNKFGYGNNPDFIISFFEKPHEK